jgi:XTP/dITP diphosphohydrolase
MAPTRVNRKLLIATGSKHKFGELRTLLALPSTELLSLADAGLSDDAPEVGETFEQNAEAKALYYAQRSRLPTLADDSGLEVDALGGQPGVRTRRFAGENPSDDENSAHLLQVLGDVPADRRTARYRAFLAYAEPTAERQARVLETAVGVFEGRIAFAPRGSGGFGYDPIFEPAEEQSGGRTVGELSADEKNARSHRGMAARAMREKLVARGF